MGMKRRYILALDQGTTGSRAFLFNSSGKIVGSAYKEFKQYFPKPGWVEHDADEIWESCCAVIKGVLRKSKVSANKIAAIGITNQRETTVLWDRTTSKPVARAIVWQCRRTSQICRKMEKHSSVINKKTGLVLDPYFSGTKVKWVLDQSGDLKRRAQRGGLCFGTIDSWLIWKLTGGQSHVTDMTNASRTLLFNIQTLKWDQELLKIFGIPSTLLGKVQNSGSVFGRTAKGQCHLPSGILITAVLGDQQAALYGQGCHKAGSVKNTYGTGCFIVLNTGKKLIHSKKGLLSTVASDVYGKPVYALEGSIFVAGAVVQWLRDQLGIIKHSSDIESLGKGVKDCAGVHFVPAFAGLGAPYWDADARGMICGLTRGAGTGHIARAALESIAYQTKDVFDIMKKELGKNIRSLNVDGGATQNNFLMQFQADLLGCEISRPKMVDSTVLGAAQLAGLTVGLWNPSDLGKFGGTRRVFSPKMDARKRKELYDGWVKAVKQVQK